MYVYLIATKAVHSSAFPALFYLTLVLSAILIRSTTWIYGGDRVCADPKHVFGFTSLLVRSQDSEKLGGGLGTRLRTHLIQFGQWTARHEILFDRSNAPTQA